MIGTSVDKTDFPYVLPGPDDTWGGTWGTSGWRTHDANILFGVEKLPKRGEWKLVVDLVDANPNRSIVKVVVNSVEKNLRLRGTLWKYWKVTCKMPESKSWNFPFRLQT